MPRIRSVAQIRDGTTHNLGKPHVVKELLHFLFLNGFCLISATGLNGWAAASVAEATVEVLSSPCCRGGLGDRNHCYPPDFVVLCNRLGIRDALTPEAAEHELVVQRLPELVPTGNFDVAHLKASYHHPFQNVHPWAGEVRTAEITKGGSPFQPGRCEAPESADMRLGIQSIMGGAAVCFP